MDELSFENLDLKISYRSKTMNGKSTLLDDFYIPCLKRSQKYDRSTGFFTSGSLKVASEGIVNFAFDNSGKMRMLTSPRLTEKDVCCINDNLENIDESLEYNLDREIFNENGLLNDEIELLGWMIKNNRLEIRLAIMLDEYGRPLKNQSSEEVFHKKMGIDRKSVV